MRQSYTETIRWEIANTPHHQVERIPPGGTFDDITFDYLVDTANIFVGSPDTVTRGLRDFYDETGGFGVLMIHAGRDYATRGKARALDAPFHGRGRAAPAPPRPGPAGGCLTEPQHLPPGPRARRAGGAEAELLQHAPGGAIVAAAFGEEAAIGKAAAQQPDDCHARFGRIAPALARARDPIADLDRVRAGEMGADHTGKRTPAPDADEAVAPVAVAANEAQRRAARERQCQNVNLARDGAIVGDGPEPRGVPRLQRHQPEPHRPARRHTGKSGRHRAYRQRRRSRARLAASQ